jgi:hypothetical protein
MGARYRRRALRGRSRPVPQALERSPGHRRWRGHGSLYLEVDCWWLLLV